MSQESSAASLLGGLGKFTELRQRLMFVVLALIVFRIGSYIPVPGVNPQAMLALMESQKGTIVDMFNMFSGGALHRFSLLALNVVPYISASIIVQLAGHCHCRRHVCCAAIRVFDDHRSAGPNGTHSGGK